MDKYTVIISDRIKFVHDTTYRKFYKNYQTVQNQLQKTIDLGNSKEYSILMKNILNKSKFSPDWLLFWVYFIIGISIIFYFDVRNALIMNIVGWIAVSYSIFVAANNSKINKVNQIIDEISYNPSDYVGFQKNETQIKSDSISNRLEEIALLYKEGKITNEEYEFMRKQIIEKY